MSIPQNILIKDYNYLLPKNKIAEYPLKERDQSKLLICRNGNISEDIFKNIHQHIPAGSLMIFNETKVIPARMIFQKKTGGRIEIFCLEPANSIDFQLSFAQKKKSTWECMVGNSSKWKNEVLEQKFKYKGIQYLLFAERIQKNETHSIVCFYWLPDDLTFAEVLECIGNIPLPPYIERAAEASDKERYQTVFALEEGSVAAPTAGLHFSKEVFENLKKNNIKSQYVVLHIGAGTFKPVKEENIVRHEMHTEHMIIQKETILQLLNTLQKEKIIAVGTTATRTLESLFWFGVKLITEKNADCEFNIEQWDPYKYTEKLGVSAKDSLHAVLEYMKKKNIDSLNGSTQLMITPEYQYRIIDGLVTNFHQPKSTLLLLIAAFLGDSWEQVYDYALENNFRFLSYGDCCLFLK